MREGDLVEFWSSENGGTWKPGVVVEHVTFFSDLSDETRTAGSDKKVRIRVGPDVCIIRDIERKGAVLVRLKIYSEALL